MFFYTSISTLDRVVLPEGASQSAEMLRSTFLTVFSVFQAFIVIAKLNRRKTKSFFIYLYFKKTISGIHLFLTSYLSEVRTLHIKGGGRGLGMSSILFESNMLSGKFNPLKWFHANAPLEFLLYKNLDA